MESDEDEETEHGEPGFVTDDGFGGRPQDFGAPPSPLALRHSPLGQEPPEWQLMVERAAAPVQGLPEAEDAADLWDGVEDPVRLADLQPRPQQAQSAAPQPQQQQQQHQQPQDPQTSSGPGDSMMSFLRANFATLADSQRRQEQAISDIGRRQDEESLQRKSEVARLDARLNALTLGSAAVHGQGNQGSSPTTAT